MPLVLPPGHPLHDSHDSHDSPTQLASAGVPARAGRAARIAVINVMPRGEVYERMLAGALAATPFAVEPAFVRLRTHAYKSTDHAHLDRYYATFEDTIGKGPIDGLILTGAPIEHLPLEKVRYWGELREILTFARQRVGSTLGICWGAIALGALLGIEREDRPQKLFGVFEHTIHPGGAALLGEAPTFLCPHSRHAGVVAADVSRAAAEGRALLLASGEGDVGPTVFASPDHRLVAHLGHPEYVASRLAFEWRRDRDLGRTDVPDPHGLDVERPVTTWAAHTATLFARWITAAAGA